MPPKIKITKDDIIKTAISLVRANGADALNARAIAAELECSTQPIFSNFATMDALQKETIYAAYEIYQSYILAEVQNDKIPRYKAFGLAYIRFAKEEKELFKLLFMRDRTKEDTSPTVDFEESVNMIMQANGVSYETAFTIHIEMWTCVHGIASMIATSFLSFEWDVISNIMSDIYQGIRSQHLSEDSSK